MSAVIQTQEFNLTNSFAEVILKISQKINDDPLGFIFVLSLLIAISVVILTVVFRKNNNIIVTLLDSLLISQKSNNYTDVEENNEKLLELNEKISNLEKLISEKDVEKINQNIKDILEKETEKHIKDHIENYIQIISKNEEIAEKILSQTTKNYLTSWLQSRSNITSVISIQREKERIDRNNEMINFIRQQSKSANTTRNAVSNIFIIMNMTLMGFYVFLGSNVGEKILITISITHVSLSAFMVYIFKASNSRISALLAILEDSNKHSKIENLLETIGEKENISSHDVELVKNYLINRAEREKQSMHPYEMIFKGINNSSIQFKGGKIELEKK